MFPRVGPIYDGPPYHSRLFLIVYRIKIYIEKIFFETAYVVLEGYPTLASIAVKSFLELLPRWLRLSIGMLVVDVVVLHSVSSFVPLDFGSK